jgi:hypothetical protein
VQNDQGLGRKESQSTENTGDKPHNTPIAPVKKSKLGKFGNFGNFDKSGGTDEILSGT